MGGQHGQIRNVLHSAQQAHTGKKPQCRIRASAHAHAPPTQLLLALVRPATAHDFFDDAGNDNINGRKDGSGRGKFSVELQFPPPRCAAKPATRKKGRENGGRAQLPGATST